MICAGEDCSFILDKNGIVWACGGNSKGQIGKDDMRYSACTTIFNKIEGLQNITSISCFEQHLLCIDSNGDLWGLGNNHQEQLGFQEPKKCHVPIKVPNISNVSSVSTYKNNSVCISDGKIFFTKKSKGFVEYDSDKTKIELKELYFSADFAVGLTVFRDQNPTESSDKMVQIACAIPSLNHCVSMQAFFPGSDVERIFIHNNNVVTMTSSGRVWACSAFSKNLLGGKNEVLNGPGDLRIDAMHAVEIEIPGCAEISCGGHHILFLDKNGVCWALGENSYGQLGVGDNDDRISPTRILCDNRITQISAGSNHSLVVDEFENIWTFGANSYGQLGIHCKDNANVPTKFSLVRSPKSATSY